VKSSVDIKNQEWKGVEFELGQIKHVNRRPKKATKKWIKRAALLLIHLYRVLIKPIPVARMLVLSCWKIAHPLYIGLVLIVSFINYQMAFAAMVLRNEAGQGGQKKWLLGKRKLIKMSDYREEKSLDRTVVFDEEEILTPAPAVSSRDDLVYLNSPHKKFTFPQISVVSCGSAKVYGGTNLVVTNDGVVCHELFDIKQDFTSEEFHGRIKIHSSSNKVRFLVHDVEQESLQIEEASSFVDSCASNYAHWLTEVLPRIAAFCSLNEYKDVPLILNSELHTNILQSIRIMAGSKRSIILLSIGRIIEVTSLKQMTVAGYVPYGSRTSLPSNSQGKFSRKALDMVREKTFLALEKKKLEDQTCRSIEETKKKIGSFKKIFLKRTSGGRRVTNSEEIEIKLESMGFLIVEPEKVDFLTQVSIFKNADTIVASSGAALANIIFCKPSTNIVILISRLKGTSYWYWQNIACASGNSVKYVMGGSINSKYHGIHSDFKIDLDELVSSI
jgi:capsular polysaccharide biosynthesis protein